MLSKILSETKWKEEWDNTTSCLLSENISSSSMKLHNCQPVPEVCPNNRTHLDEACRHGHAFWLTLHRSHLTPCLCLSLWDYDSLSHPLKVLSCKSRKRLTFLLSAEVEQHTPHLTSSCGNRYPGNRQSGDIDNCVEPRWGDFHSCHFGTEHGGYVWWLKMNTVNLSVFSDSAFRSFHVSWLSLKQDE